MPTKKQIVASASKIADYYSAYALELSNGSTIKEKLASVLIYAALAEYAVDIFINSLAGNMNKNSSNHKVKFSSNVISSNGNTNLESALHKLRNFEYPKKKEIEEKIKLIKDSRNKVFHDLFNASEKEIILDIKIVIIQDHVPLLRRMLVDSLLKQLS